MPIYTPLYLFPFAWVPVGSKPLSIFLLGFVRLASDAGRITAELTLPTFVILPIL
jgi:hypothetical protein